uniref:Uncharacterized protein n=1 Tax=Siphoviridae sp. ctKwY15 TaxID=2827843 RepID=A0A8S5STZ8_9CAUD|nr:MAG TPA: hypothetical protein [Siphoviridae sp. ctKwY15]
MIILGTLNDGCKNNKTCANRQEMRRFCYVKLCKSNKV